MKILTKEEEQEHYSTTIKGGFIGGMLGLGVGALGVWAASKRYHAVRGLTIQFRAFLAVSSGTFASIIAADKASRNFELERDPARQYTDQNRTLSNEYDASKPALQRARDWGNQNRYSIVFGSWVASMGIALGLVQRNKYLSGAQKLVQARVYAQGLTVAVLLASFALEGNDAAKGKGRWETIKVLDPNDPTHKKYIEKKIHHERYEGEDQWRDMVEAEERRMKDRQQAIKEHEERDRDLGKKTKAKTAKATGKEAADSS
ncbi:hypothetical protein EJ08DRAFT_669502 [Tothia fuscella]|uniref:HIG1 domain-containing protein n=1 Tax=Tothia fuscella TaxID=1048955 RepID=A0A9P4NVZ0_9PEZI|nr:hypothetical protein EJ08DRAFT_669502 [Tothia fuscella]